MKKTLVIFACLAIFVVGNVFAQSIVGTWRCNYSQKNATGKGYFVFNEDNSYCFIINFVEKASAGKGVLTLTTNMETPGMWKMEGKTITTVTDNNQAEINVNSSFTGGTAAEKREYEEEGEYYRQQYEDNLYAELNREIVKNKYKVLLHTATTLKLLGEGSNKPIVLTKVAKK